MNIENTEVLEVPTSFSDHIGIEAETPVNTVVDPSLLNLIEERSSFMKTHINGDEFGYISSTFRPNVSEDIPSLWEAFKLFSPTEAYYKLDEGMRGLLMYFSEDLEMGMGASIVLVSFLIKLAFTPLQMKAQTQGIKMKLVAPEMKEYNNKIQAHAKKGDYGAITQVKREMNAFKKKIGLSGATAMMSLGQMPFLFTWFIGIRYMAMSPDLFPSMETEGFLWFQNLCEYDPYFVLPLLSATLTSLNISMSPNAQGGAGGNSMISKYLKFMKFLPFIGFPVLMSFPSGMTLYWVTVAGVQLVSTLAIRSKRWKKMQNIEGYIPGTYLHKIHNTNNRSRVGRRNQENSETKTEFVGLNERATISKNSNSGMTLMTKNAENEDIKVSLGLKSGSRKRTTQRTQTYNSKPKANKETVSKSTFQKPRGRRSQSAPAKGGQKVQFTKARRTRKPRK